MIQKLAFRYLNNCFLAEESRNVFSFDTNVTVVCRSTDENDTYSSYKCVWFVQTDITCVLLLLLEHCTGPSGCMR